VLQVVQVAEVLIEHLQVVQEIHLPQHQVKEMMVGQVVQVVLPSLAEEEVVLVRMVVQESVERQVGMVAMAQYPLLLGIHLTMQVVAVVQQKLEAI